MYLPIPPSLSLQGYIPAAEGAGRKTQRGMKAAPVALFENTDTPQQPMKDAEGRKAYNLLAGSVLQQKALRSGGVQFCNLLYNLPLSHITSQSKN